MRNLLHYYIKILEKNNQLIRIKEEVNPDLEMASIHLRCFKENNKAVFFENIKGSKYKALSNLFGTIERSKLIFRKNLEIVEHLIELKTNPTSSLNNPVKSLFTALNLIYAIPRKVCFPRNFKEIILWLGAVVCCVIL